MKETLYYTTDAQKKNCIKPRTVLLFSWEKSFKQRQIDKIYINKLLAKFWADKRKTSMRKIMILDNQLINFGRENCEKILTKKRRGVGENN